MTWTIYGTPARQILDRIDQDERLGAICEDYKGGDFVVRINLYKIGSLDQFPMPKGWLTRWRIKRGFGPFSWSWQANYDGAFVASGSDTRSSARAEAIAAINEIAARRIASGEETR